MLFTPLSPRWLRSLLALTLTLTTLTHAAPTPSSSSTTDLTLLPRDTPCTLTSAHPNPIILLHGLGATSYEDINLLHTYLTSRAYCVFVLTYGSPPLSPYLGGLAPIATSARQIAAFINATLAATGAQQVDLVGHSEGAFLTLYIPKFTGLAPKVDRIVAIAPPTHGTSFAGLYNLTYLLPGQPPLLSVLVNGVLVTGGCDACVDLLPGGPAVTQLDSGPIVQAGNQLTVIASRADELVTPTTTAFVQEGGVTNEYVQDYCPLDQVGHLDEAYDPNVWEMVRCGLEGITPCVFTCVEESLPVRV